MPPTSHAWPACVQEEVLLWLIHVNDLSTHPRVRVGRAAPRRAALGRPPPRLPPGHLLCSPRLCQPAALPACLPGRHHRSLVSPPLPHHSTAATSPQVSARLTRQPGNRKLRVSIYQIFSTSTLSSSLISGTWQRKNADTEEDELVAVDLRFLLSMLDGFDGSPFMEQMDRLVGGWVGVWWRWRGWWHRARWGQGGRGAPAAETELACRRERAGLARAEERWQPLAEPAAAASAYLPGCLPALSDCNVVLSLALEPGALPLPWACLQADPGV